MNNETNEPRVAPPKVSYANKEALRRAPQQTTYPTRVWAAAALVAMMVGAAGALWSPSQEQIEPKSPTIAISQVAQPLEIQSALVVLLDTAAIQPLVRPLVRSTTKPCPSPKEAVPAKLRVEVARIEVDRIPFIALNAKDMEIRINRQQEQPTENGRQRFNPLKSFEDAFAVDWKAQAEYRAQVMTRQRNLLQEIPQKFSKIFASSKTSKKDQNNENN